jgi:predicted nucleic acid-binding Zn ribbon protein
MERTDSQLIAKVLERYFDENPELVARLAENRLLNSWEKITGPAIARYTGHLFVKNKCLYVQLNSSIVKNELMMCREKLIQTLNREAGRFVISKIVFT